MTQPLKSLAFKIHSNKPQITTLLLCMLRIAKIKTGSERNTLLLPNELVFIIIYFLDTYIDTLTERINNYIENISFYSSKIDDQDLMWIDISRILSESDKWKPIILAEWEYGNDLKLTELRKENDKWLWMAAPSNYVFYFIMNIIS